MGVGDISWNKVCGKLMLLKNILSSEVGSFLDFKFELVIFFYGILYVIIFFYIMFLSV